MLLRIHIVPARRDRFEVRVGTAAEQLARRLARGLSSAPRLAGEGHATRGARGSDDCEQQRHCFACARAAVCSVQRAVVQQLYGCDFDSQLDSCAVQMCSMGVRGRQATAMLSNDSPAQAAGLLVPYRPLALLPPSFFCQGSRRLVSGRIVRLQPSMAVGRSQAFWLRPVPK